MSGIFDFDVTSLSGQDQSIADYEGRVLLIVNTASKCGFTPQYAGLETLWKELEPKGLTVLGFPCNQFGAQEPGQGDEIAEFCQINYGVSFPMHQKVKVNGGEAHPLFKYLKGEAKGVLGSKAIKWNFTKFLVSRDGKSIKRYGPKTTPKQIRADIEKALANS